MNRDQKIQVIAGAEILGQELLQGKWLGQLVMILDELRHESKITQLEIDNQRKIIGMGES